MSINTRRIYSTGTSIAAWTLLPPTQVSLLAICRTRLDGSITLIPNTHLPHFPFVPHPHLYPLEHIPAALIQPTNSSTSSKTSATHVADTKINCFNNVGTADQRLNNENDSFGELTSGTYDRSHPGGPGAI